jgi:hypothetical protein
MAKMPNIRGPDRNKPLCYDPQHDRLITIDDLIAGKAKIVSPDNLTRQQQKRLVMERYRAGPDHTVQTISGPARTRDQVIQEIEAESEFGRMAVDAELMYLGELLQQIEEALKARRPPA